MPPRPASTGARIACAIISVLALVVWVLQLVTLADLGHSDAAGNAMAQAFAGIEIVVLWALLAVLLLITGVAGRLPWLAALPAVVLLPASGVAAIITLDLLTDHGKPPYLWPIIIPALVPPIIVAFSCWTLPSSLRAAIPTGTASAVTWGATLALCIALWPMAHMRSEVVEHEATVRAKWAEDFARLPPNASLADLVPFLNTRDETRQDAVLTRMRSVGNRQAEAEAMLDRGDFPLLYLGSLDLEPTPSLCEKARALLHRQVQPLIATSPGTRPYSDVADKVDAALQAMKWLVGYGCSCNDESREWEDMAKGYRDPNFDVYELAELREPQTLGRRLLQSPDRFSMLTPQSHLRAWLKFAHDAEYHDPALNGARQLDHKTADAVEMLEHDEFEAATVLAFLPELDLSTTEPLCAASLKAVHERLAPIYRPRSDDPRSYDEFLNRLGGDMFLTSLLWLASHGCDADKELSEAEDIIRTYQDSPERTATLVQLSHLRRKP